MNTKQEWLGKEGPSLFLSSVSFQNIFCWLGYVLYWYVRWVLFREELSSGSPVNRSPVFCPIKISRLSCIGQTLISVFFICPLAREIFSIYWQFILSEKVSLLGQSFPKKVSNKCLICYGLNETIVLHFLFPASYVMKGWKRLIRSHCPRHEYLLFLFSRSFVAVASGISNLALSRSGPTPLLSDDNREYLASFVLCKQEKGCP